MQVIAALAGDPGGTGREPRLGFEAALRPSLALAKGALTTALRLLSGTPTRPMRCSFFSVRPSPHPEGRSVVASRGPEAREAVSALEERREGLVEAAEHLLKGRERPAPEAIGIGGAARLEFGRLLLVAQADAATTVGFDTLLQPSIVETAEVAQHRVESRGLHPGRAQTKLIAADRRTRLVPRVNPAPHDLRIPPSPGGDGPLRKPIYGVARLAEV